MADSLHIVSYSNDILRSFLALTLKGYADSKKIKIPFRVWRERADAAILKDPKGLNTTLITPGLVRYTDTKTVYAQLKTIEKETAALTDELTLYPEKSLEINQKLYELQSKALKPITEFEYSGQVEIDGHPAWYASSINGVNVRIGPANLDLSKPHGFFLSDDKVHANIQGSTGSGKTVKITNIIFNVSMEYPPWEVDLKLIDNKIAEFHLFARAAQLPHATVVAATKAKEFLLDLYSSFLEETNQRQEIFNATQCNSKKNFCKKFNLVLPEVVIIIDEYVAMLLAIESTAAKGNNNSGEEKQAIESVLLTLATQSRNAGIHFIISSQDLGSKLNENISKQIHVGSTLAGTVDIYNGCINNSEVVIDRKGMCVVNTERLLQNNAEYNTITGVPFIDTEETPGRPLNPAQEQLIMLADKARDINFKKEFFFYDANAKIPYKIFEEEVVASFSSIQASDGELLYDVPLGTKISYRTPDQCHLQVSLRKENNVIYYSTDDNLSRYIAQTLYSVMSMQQDRAKISVYYTEPSSFAISELAEKVHQENIHRVRLFPPVEIEVYQNRAKFIRYQELVFAKAGEWDIKTLIERVAENYKKASFLKDYENQYREEVIPYLNGAKKGEETTRISLLIPDNDRLKFNKILLDCRLCCLLRDSVPKPASVRIEANEMRPIVNFWFGLEDVDNIRDEDFRQELADYFNNCTAMNILNVVNSRSPYKIHKLLSGFNFALEFANKDFWSELEFGGPFMANVNTDSFILHDRRKSTHTILKIYGGL